MGKQVWCYRSVVLGKLRNGETEAGGRRGVEVQEFKAGLDIRGRPCIEQKGRARLFWQYEGLRAPGLSALRVTGKSC